MTQSPPPSLLSRFGAYLRHVMGGVIAALAFMVLAGMLGVFLIIEHYSADLPDYKKLEDYEPSIATRIHASDGRLLDEFATERRIFMPITEIPDLVKHAFLASEDRRFYQHPGIDFVGISRAVMTNLSNLGSNRRLVGGSTITQQVAKNFLLTNEVSFERKIKEAIIAFRIERAYPKDRILELYLNEIYLGRGNYGVAAAAMGYFGKSLRDLTIDEAAYLAVLPKAPNNYQIDDDFDQALARRNWVIDRMFEDHYITEQEKELAQAATLTRIPAQKSITVDADYFVEDVRREIAQRYGDDALYGGGLSVRTTLDPKLQEHAVYALSRGIIRYDLRHGYRGPVQSLQDVTSWQEALKNVEDPKGMMPDWQVAIVLDVTKSSARVGLRSGLTGVLKAKDLQWALRHERSENVRDLFSVNDIIIVLPQDPDALLAAEDAALHRKELPELVFNLRQIPAVQGGLIVLDPHTGRVLAMQGGFSHALSEFNRATQARRQPGSAIKPFVYLSALDKGFTPSNLILDAPVVIDQGPGLPKWRPSNYNDEYYGLTTLRRGLEKSRNMMTVRLADHVGIENVIDYAKKFNIYDDVPNYLSLALGSGETTLMRMASAYAVLVNGGKKITPSMIDRIQNRYGETIHRHDARLCDFCGNRLAWQHQPVPQLDDPRERLADPRTAYQIVSILEGAVQRGTGVAMKNLNWPIGGKTGTTNDYKDAWFIGFTPDLVVAAYLGFDEPRSLGHKETGSRAALPVVKFFFEKTLAELSPTPFRTPKNVRMLRVDPATGKLARPGQRNTILEAFIPGTEPRENMIILDAHGVSSPSNQTLSDPGRAAQFGTGGIY